MDAALKEYETQVKRKPPVELTVGRQELEGHILAAEGKYKQAMNELASASLAQRKIRYTRAAAISAAGGRSDRRNRIAQWSRCRCGDCVPARVVAIAREFAIGEGTRGSGEAREQQDQRCRRPAIAPARLGFDSGWRTRGCVGRDRRAFERPRRPHHREIQISQAQSLRRIPVAGNRGGIGTARRVEFFRRRCSRRESGECNCISRKRSKTCALPEPAWGLSRYAFDAMLLDRAVELGSELVREADDTPRIIATGRADGSAMHRGNRLFGFKTHFTGPVDDAVELFFFDGCYVGVNVVEGGRTNVCGLGPEDRLNKIAFDYDAWVRKSPKLAARLAPLTREMNWLSTGPLRYRQNFDPLNRSYLAGDALSFVDPFTGSGLLAAVKTGALAGTAAAHDDSVESYLRQCRASLRKPFEVAGIFRKAVESGWAEILAGLIPGKMLFALTRPH